MRGSLRITLSDKVRLGDNIEEFEIEFPFELQTVLDPKKFNNCLFTAINQNLAAIITAAGDSLEDAREKLLKKHEKSENVKKLNSKYEDDKVTQQVEENDKGDKVAEKPDDKVTQQVEENEETPVVDEETPVA